MKAIALAVAVMLAAGCESEAPRPRRLLMPVARVLDEPSPTHDAAVAWGTHVTIAGETRLAIAPTVDTSTLWPMSPPPADSGTAAWSVPVPATLRDAPWLLVRAALVPAEGAPILLPQRLVRAAGENLSVPNTFDPKTADLQVRVAMAAAPALASYDVVGAPLVVPAGAVATAGMGIDEGAWSVDSGPVELHIGVVEDGRETVLDRRTLDPARRTDDRRWVDVRVDLSAWAGRRVQLALRAVGADPTRPEPSLPVWADPIVLAPRPAWMPNVILMSLDTLRAKSVSAYGAARPTTPNLDRMVGEAGTIFDEAYTPAPHTQPAHMSTFTGLYPRAFPSLNIPHPLSRDVRTLPERLRAAGYETGAFTEDGFIIPRIGFRRGFSTYVENTSPDFHEPLGQSAKTFRQAADWLVRHRDHPTFLFVHTYEVHTPYTPAPPYDRAFESGDGLADETALSLLRYEQEARHLDDEIRAFLDAVDGMGLGTRTLLVVMGDHGEEFREHGQRFHGFQLYDETSHVPLMLRWPGVVPAGLRVTTPVSLVDVLPTVLDLLALPPPIGIHGMSLVPLLAGGTLAREAVFGEVPALVGEGADVVSARTADRHFVFHRANGTVECFDPAVDRDEKEPLRGNATRGDVARREVSTYLALRRLAARAPVTADEAPRDEQTEQQRREKLRGLGYVE